MHALLFLPATLATGKKGKGRRIRLTTIHYRGDVRVCDKYDRLLTFPRGRTEQSSCYQPGGGGGFLCSQYQPIPVSKDLSLGFAAVGEVRACCRCYEIQWLEGPAKGKRMQVQGVSNAPGSGTDITLLIPGGGSGPNPQGCTAQYGGIVSVFLSCSAVSFLSFFPSLFIQTCKQTSEN